MRGGEITVGMQAVSLTSKPILQRRSVDTNTLFSGCRPIVLPSSLFVSLLVLMRQRHFFIAVCYRYPVRLFTARSRLP